MIDVDAAREELLSMSKAQIDSETADKWAARALAALELALEAKSAQEQMRWLMDMREYEHEAGEHASGAGVEKLQEIQEAVAHHKRELRARHAGHHEEQEEHEEYEHEEYEHEEHDHE